MNGITHERIAKILFPELDTNLVHKINREIDTPQPWMPENAPGQLPGMNYGGHRKQGHDLFTAAMVGYMNGGPAGVKAAWTHLMGDMMRDQIVKAVGYEGANVYESMWNYMYGQNKKRR